MARARSYVRNVRGVLRKALADARRLGLVRTNAAADVDLSRVRRGELRAWDAAQLGRSLRHVEDDRLGPLWRFLVATGVRRGEALGLRWPDVDLEGRSVTIRRSRVVASSRVVEGEPKTEAGQRNIAIDEATAGVLRSWKSARAADFVGRSLDAQPLPRDAVTNL